MRDVVRSPPRAAFGKASRARWTPLSRRDRLRPPAHALAAPRIQPVSQVTSRSVPATPPFLSPRGRARAAVAIQDGQKTHGRGHHCFAGRVFGRHEAHIPGVTVSGSCRACPCATVVATLRAQGHGPVGPGDVYPRRRVASSGQGVRRGVRAQDARVTVACGRTR